MAKRSRGSSLFTDEAKRKRRIGTVPDAKGVFVTGTGTEVGKTVVAAAIIRALMGKGMKVGAMKPIETGCKRKEFRIQDSELKARKQKIEIKEDDLIPSDGLFLRKMAEMDDPVDLISPVRFEHPLAPMVVSKMEDRPVDLDRVFAAYAALSRKYDFIVVEGAGGLLVPIKDHRASGVKRQATTVKDNNSLGARRSTLDSSPYFMADLIRDLRLPAVVVAGPGLGTVNHTLLTIEYARSAGIDVLGIILNYASPPKGSIAEKTNPDILKRLCPVPVIGIFPHTKRITLKDIEAASRCIDIGAL